MAIGIRRQVLVVALAVAWIGSGAVPGWGQGIPLAPGQQGRLQADRVRYDARAQVLTAEGNVRLTVGDLELRAARLVLEQKTLVARASGAVTIRQAGFALEASVVRYEIRRRLVRAEGSVRLVQGDITVSAAAVLYAFEAQVLTAAGSVTAAQGANTLTGQTLQANLKSRQAEVAGDAQLVRRSAGEAGRDDPAAPAQVQEIVIRASRLRLRWDTNEASAEGGVTIRQGATAARAGQARYDEASGRLDLVGSVVIDELGEAGSGATLAADRVVVLLRTRDLDATGNVRVAHKGRTASGNRAAYRDQSGTLVLTGRVHLQDEDGNIIRADMVTISLPNETFEASGNVETVFSVRRSK